MGRNFGQPCRGCQAHFTRAGLMLAEGGRLWLVGLSLDNDLLMGCPSLSQGDSTGDWIFQHHPNQRPRALAKE